MAGEHADPPPQIDYDPAGGSAARLPIFSRRQSFGGIPDWAVRATGRETSRLHKIGRGTCVWTRFVQLLDGFHRM